MRFEIRTVSRAISTLVILGTLVFGASVGASAQGNSRWAHNRGRHLGWERGRRVGQDRRELRRDLRSERRDLRRNERRERRSFNGSDRSVLQVRQRQERADFRTHQRGERERFRDEHRGGRGRH
jgi:hypothetical protein